MVFIVCWPLGGLQEVEEDEHGCAMVVVVDASCWLA
jgi:hypothetical protein